MGRGSDCQFLWGAFGNPESLAGPAVIPWASRVAPRSAFDVAGRAGCTDWGIKVPSRFLVVIGSSAVYKVKIAF
jgi:hypothetical protein